MAPHAICSEARRKKAAAVTSAETRKAQQARPDPDDQREVDHAQWKAEKEDASAAKERGSRVCTLEKASSGLEHMGVTKDDFDRLEAILCTSLEDHLHLYNLSLEDE